MEKHVTGEEAILDEIFSEGKKWDGKYTISWCHQCDTAVIVCPSCGFSSCSGGGCERCKDDFGFRDAKRHVSDYLTEDELKIYKKCLRLQKFIKLSLELGHKEIPWCEFGKQGQFSQIDREIFVDFIPTDCEYERVD